MAQRSTFGAKNILCVTFYSVNQTACVRIHDLETTMTQYVADRPVFNPKRKKHVKCSTVRKLASKHLQRQGFLC